MAGLPAPDASRDRHRDVYVANLKTAAARAGALGRTLLIEPINRRQL